MIGVAAGVGWGEVVRDVDFLVAGWVAVDVV